MFSFDLDKLKVELKTWEHEFIEKNNREPTRDDIKSLRNVRQMYKQYSLLKKKQSLQTQEPFVHKSIEIAAHNKNNDEMGEIGPTPQVHGKAISIFEMNLSPIKPIYMAFTNDINMNNDSSKTISNVSSPEKTISVNSSPANRTLVAESISNVKRQLNFQIPKVSLSRTPISSPCKKQDELHAENKKFSPTTKPLLESDKSSRYYGPNSPLRLDEENIHLNIPFNSKIKRRLQMGYPSLLKTPSKDNHVDISNSFSPSPLIRRPLTKSLIELAKEHTEIVKEFSILEEEGDRGENGEEGSDEGCNADKCEEEEESKLEDGLIRSKVMADIFQEDEVEGNQGREGAFIRKRPKRRKVIRRSRENDLEDETSIVKRDVHKELMKLKKRKVAEFLGSTSQLSETESENDDEATGGVIPKQKPASKRKGRKKYNLVSNNFRRLKLPKKNRFFNRRSGRR
ncbi:hypothetical protein SMKI_11G1060 [Saccharomyces mikatae IFO 1815]|uniref:DNA replication regulator SLD2 n=1 Tax=Saccharomyces mikatae IFO 1815 TaxID=226126 RepID=A0AA35IPR8_SACMI|nr:uncharacterized protein SMKI_11G1060 [Saccharomyces mikatae IFO 1815]CAI4034658.1 hypothetical protein SMKI_11G1060 [Saccharomyces mikatae IFO 1815]